MGYFDKMNLRRQNFGMGVVPISYSEIRSWSLLNGIELQPFEVHALDMLEIVYINRARSND